MTGNVQELYQQTVRPLPEQERLQLAALILNDISHGASKPKRKGDITKFFGAWKGGSADDSDNEQIDRDLARAYGTEGKDGG